MPQKGGQTGWILETNESMNRAMEGMGDDRRALPALRARAVGAGYLPEARGKPQSAAFRGLPHPDARLE